MTRAIDLGRRWAGQNAHLRAPIRADAVWALAGLTDGPFMAVGDDAPGHDPDRCCHFAGRCVLVSDQDALEFCRAAAEVLLPRLERFLSEHGDALPESEWDELQRERSELVAFVRDAGFCAHGCDAVAVWRGLCGPCARDCVEAEEGK